MKRVDLDAIEAETTGEHIEAVIGDRVFKIHPDLRWNTSKLWDDNDLDGSLRTLLIDPTEGDEWVRLLTRDNPTRVVLAARVNAIFSTADDLVGEAPASSDS